MEFQYDCLMDYMIDLALLQMEENGETLPETRYSADSDEPVEG